MMHFPQPSPTLVACVVCLYGSVPGNVCSHGTLRQGALGVCQCWYGITTDYLGYAFPHWQHWKGPVLNDCSNLLMLLMLFSVWFASHAWMSLKKKNHFFWWTYQAFVSLEMCFIFFLFFHCQMIICQMCDQDASTAELMLPLLFIWTWNKTSSYSILCLLI